MDEVAACGDSVRADGANGASSIVAACWEEIALSGRGCKRQLLPGASGTPSAPLHIPYGGVVMVVEAAEVEEAEEAAEAKPALEALETIFAMPPAAS